MTPRGKAIILFAVQNGHNPFTNPKRQRGNDLAPRLRSGLILFGTAIGI